MKMTAKAQAKAEVKAQAEAKEKARMQAIYNKFYNLYIERFGDEEIAKLLCEKEHSDDDDEPYEVFKWMTDSEGHRLGYFCK